MFLIKLIGLKELIGFMELIRFVELFGFIGLIGFIDKAPKKVTESMTRSSIELF